MPQTNKIGVAEKPIPGGGRPRPNLKPSINQVKVVYDYNAQDVDELNLKEGDFLDLIKERKSFQYLVQKLSYF